MPADSIRAYDLPERVAAYDADMEIMHPNRGKMIAVALEVLPFPPEQPLTAIDLGIGTGYFSRRFLERFPSARVSAVDGAAAMVDLARARLGPLAERVAFQVGDFRKLAQLLADVGPVDVVYSSYALHHLNADEKRDVIRQSANLLKPGGWFLNADLVVAECPDVEARIQQLRVEGILRRAPRSDARFQGFADVRAFLDRLEANEGDQPLTLARDLELARQAGLANVELFWREYREAVFGGTKPERAP